MHVDIYIVEWHNNLVHVGCLDNSGYEMNSVFIRRYYMTHQTPSL